MLTAFLAAARIPRHDLALRDNDGNDDHNKEESAATARDTCKGHNEG